MQPGPHHLSDMEWKVGRNAKTFSIYCFMINHGIENDFENHFLFNFINKHEIMWQWCTQYDHHIRVMVKHWELPKSIQFSNCLQETQTLVLVYSQFQSSLGSLKEGSWAGTSHLKENRLWESQFIPILGWLRGPLLLKFSHDPCMVIPYPIFP